MPPSSAEFHASNPRKTNGSSARRRPVRRGAMKQMAANPAFESHP